MIELDKYELNNSEKSLFILGLASASAIVSYLFYRNIAFAFLAIVFAKRIKGYVIDAIIEKRTLDYQLQMKDMFFLLATSIGAGRSMKDAISEAIPGLENIYGHESILAGELRKAHKRIECGRESDVKVLSELAMASGLEDMIDYVTIYSICLKTGASLVIALNRAAAILMDKITIDREIKELVQRKKKEGMVIFIMPVIVILFLNLCAPDYINPLYTTVQGRLIMTLILMGNIAVWGMIQRIVKVEI